MSVRIFSGNSNPELARSICGYLGTELGRARVGRFSDGETRIEIDESAITRGGELSGFIQQLEQSWREALAPAGESCCRVIAVVHLLHLPAIEAIELIHHASGAGTIGCRHGQGDQAGGQQSQHDCASVEASLAVISIHDWVLCGRSRLLC